MLKTYETRNLTPSSGFVELTDGHLKLHPVPGFIILELRTKKPENVDHRVPPEARQIIETLCWVTSSALAADHTTPGSSRVKPDMFGFVKVPTFGRDLPPIIGYLAGTSSWRLASAVLRAIFAPAFCRPMNGSRDETAFRFVNTCSGLARVTDLELVSRNRENPTTRAEVSDGGLDVGLIPNEAISRGLWAIIE
ncbi:hypothetical protein N7539_005568 [Penicillium diatomitis]|uniref:Uncharacterized protein n=1 Tax=Penicillium diatomitis TaxID=2819901 RepID=A0A9X0BVE7_9EURO|nr:uncharacterized protein N7539_005568 [Penicillium diatomitis]KAJ5485580.1 hypothetical protein N7539_005568 [Penicillium diatomitis]